MFLPDFVLPGPAWREMSASHPDYVDYWRATPGAYCPLRRSRRFRCAEVIARKAMLALEEPGLCGRSALLAARQTRRTFTALGGECSAEDRAQRCHNARSQAATSAEGSFPADRADPLYQAPALLIWSPPLAFYPVACTHTLVAIRAWFSTSCEAVIFGAALVAVLPPLHPGSDPVPSNRRAPRHRTVARQMKPAKDRPKDESPHITGPAGRQKTPMETHSGSISGYRPASCRARAICLAPASNVSSS